MSLEPFDFEPTYQPDPDTKVSFRLKPLDLRGQTEILFSRDEDGVPSWKGRVAASRYIVGWTGTDLGSFSPTKVQKIVAGGPSLSWALWLTEIAVHLYASIRLPETDEKKS